MLNLPDISATDETAENSSIVENESFESVYDPLNALGLQDMRLPLFQKSLESLKMIM